MPGDKATDPKDKPIKPADIPAGDNKHGHITQEDHKTLLKQDKQQTAANHDKLIQAGVLKNVEISDHSKTESHKGFFSNLVDGISNVIANADKQKNDLIDGTKHNLDEAMKKTGVSDDVRNRVNQGVGDVTDAIKNPEKAAGQALDQIETAIDQGMKNAGVSDDVRKGVDTGIHTIRRIDEAELKLIKGVGKGIENLVGGALHGIASLGAETLDKAEEYRKTNPVAAADITGTTTIAAAAIETGIEKVGQVLGAAEKFGEQLKEDADKEGGLDKLVAKKSQETLAGAQGWVTETNIENIGQKAEQTGEIIPDVAALAVGGLVVAKTVAKTAEVLNTLNKGAKVAEVTETITTTTGTITDGTATGAEATTTAGGTAQGMESSQQVPLNKLSDLLKQANQAEGVTVEAAAETGESQGLWRLGEREPLAKISQTELGVGGQFEDFQAAWGKKGDVVTVSIDNIKSQAKPSLSQTVTELKEFAKAHDGNTLVVKFVEGNPELRELLSRRYKKYFEKTYDGYNITFPLRKD